MSSVHHGRRGSERHGHHCKRAGCAFVHPSLRQLSPLPSLGGRRGNDHPGGAWCGGDLLFPRQRPLSRADPSPPKILLHVATPDERRHTNKLLRPVSRKTGSWGCAPSLPCTSIPIVPCTHPFLPCTHPSLPCTSIPKSLPCTIVTIVYNNNNIPHPKLVVCGREKRGGERERSVPNSS